MTTRILAPRIARLVVASILVYGVATGLPRSSLVMWLVYTTSLVGLAWFIVLKPDRPWFVAATLVGAAGLAPTDHSSCGSSGRRPSW